MKKQIISLLLVLMLLVSFILSSCSILSGDSTTVTDENGDEVTEDMSNRTPVTLTFWLPTQEGTTEEAVKAVESALNEIFKASFTTAIDFRAIPEDQYQAEVMAQVQKLEKKIEEDRAESSRQKEILESLRKAGITTVADSTTETAETVIETFVNDFGHNETRYPSVGEYQFDIFLVTSFDMYVNLVDEHDALTSLNDSLNGVSKVLKSYIYPTFLEAVASEYGTSLTYAIPNNHGMGEYKFLLTNKELAAKYDYGYNYETEATANLRPIKYYEDFIRDVARYEEDDSVVPLLSWVEPAGMTYWSDNGEWSVLASTVDNLATYNTSAPLSNIFKNSEYKANFKLMKEFEEAGMIAEDPENVEKFAVGVVSGQSRSQIEAIYGEEYNISIYERPVATQEEVFAGAFAVSSATKNLGRAMEIITAINTRPEVRNLLQYGIEGVNYKLNDNGLVERLNHEYMMNIVHTGNTYIAYPEEGMDPHQWEYDKERNLETIMSPYLYVPGMRNNENAQYYKTLTTLSAEYYEKMMATSLEDADEFFNNAAAEVAANEAFSQMGGGSWEFGAATIYNTFYSDNYATEEPGEDDPGAEGGEGAGAETPAE